MKTERMTVRFKGVTHGVQWAHSEVADEAAVADYFATLTLTVATDGDHGTLSVRLPLDMVEEVLARAREGANGQT